MAPMNKQIINKFFEECEREEAKKNKRAGRKNRKRTNRNSKVGS